MSFTERRTGAAAETAYMKKRHDDFIHSEKRGRPLLHAEKVKDRRISVNLNKSQARRLEEIASYNTMSGSTLVRVAVQHFLDNYADILGKK